MDILGLGPDYSVALLLLIAGAFAGFVDSIVGGGGLVSVPAFLLTNLPPAMALGTNKCSSIFGAATASITFIRNGMVDFHFVKKLLPFVFVGSMLGTFCVISLPPLYVKPLLIILLIGVMTYVLTKKSWGEVNRKTAVVGKALYACMGMVLCLGFYDGFIGPGVGTFFIMGFIYTGFDFVHASGNAKVMNFTSNLASLLVFIAMGYVNFFFGLSCAVGQIVGASMGARLAILKGSGFVRAVFIIVTSVMLIKLIWDYVSTIL